MNTNSKDLVLISQKSDAEQFISQLDIDQDGKVRNTQLIKGEIMIGAKIKSGTFNSLGFLSRVPVGLEIPSPRKSQVTFVKL